MANKNITALIDNSIPQFIRMEYPNFVEFIKVYYSQQEQQGSGYEFIANLVDYADVDRTTLEFLDNFSEQYLHALPRNILPAVDKRVLIKYIKEYYQSIGNEASFKFLFRILYDEDITLYYPSADMLRVSHGKWQNDVVIKVTNSHLDEHIKELEGTEITGEVSNSIGLVEKVSTYVSSKNVHTAEIYLTEIDPVRSINNFIVGEHISGYSLSECNDGAHTFYEKILPLMCEAVINSPGQHYSAGDLIAVTSATGADAFVIVDQTESGSIDSIEIIKGGTNYVIGDIITFESQSGRSAKAIVSAIDGAGAITGLNLINSGYGYDTLPIPVINSVSGSGAVLYPKSSSIGKITKTKMVNHGVNYTLQESGGFPLQFPITFQASADKGSLVFYHIMYAYDDTWNSIPYSLGEVIQGLVSGARGIIKRISDNGIIAYSLINGQEFQPGEEIIGETNLGAGYKVHEIFSASGEITAGAIGVYDGYFRNTDGFLDSNKYIQDSYYYQVFSYVINTIKPKQDWVNSIKNGVHPSGTIAFGFGDVDPIEHETSFGGWISPLLNTIEFYKFRWDRTGHDILTPADYGNTQIYHFTDYTIEELTYFDPEVYPTEVANGANDYVKTEICYGSDIRFETLNEGQTVLIDDTFKLWIDLEGNVILI